MTRGPSQARIRLADIKAIAFDGYGTIINFTEPDFIQAMAEICGEQGLEADAGEVWKRFIKASIHFRSENHDEPVYRRYDHAWEIQFERVFKQMRLSGDARAAAMHLKRSLSEAPVFDEVPGVLDALRPKYDIALLSNADDDFLLACLERNGLEFETVVTSENVGAIKPDPKIFLHLASALGVRPSEVLYAGDNPVPDVLGPSRAGMMSAWINRTGARKPRNIPQPDIRTSSLTALATLLGARFD